MSTNEARRVIALTVHARRVPEAERARFGRRLRETMASRALILETCHRVEGYVILDAAEAGVASTVPLPAGGRIHAGEDAVRHAVSVAAGRDSVVAGEDQVLHQIRESVDAARSAGILDPAIERLFALALRAGRLSRSWRQGPRRSLADVALSSLEQGGGPVRGREVLIVGAGRMGRLAANAAVAAGASVAVANRSVAAADMLAISVGGRSERLDPGPALGRFVGIIVALAGPWRIRRPTIDALAAGRTVVVDLSTPPAVPAELVRHLGRRLVTADDLVRMELEPATHDRSEARLDRLVEETVAQFVRWEGGHDARALAAALVRRADHEREAELDALWRRLPHLEPDARLAIEGMTRHLAGRLLREPLERLGRDADGRDEAKIRDIFAL